jgi:hypothetical protein
MKTAKTITLILSLLITTSIWCQRPAGLREDASMLTELLTRNVRSLIMGTIHYDLVNAGYAPTKEEKNALLRIASMEPNGWAVRVLSPEGALMMTGLYADEQLTVPNGRFTYFYSNGQIESSGLFQGGLKRGVWFRYNALGGLLAERVYEGLDTEGMLIKEGWATLASAK